MENPMNKFLCFTVAVSLGATGALAGTAGHFAGSNLLPMTKVPIAGPFLSVRLASAFDPNRTLAPVRASARLNPRRYRLLRRPAASILGPGSPDPSAQAKRGESIMQRVVVLACAALAFGMFGSP